MKSFDSKDWELFCEIARNEPFKEHTELQTVEKAAVNPHYCTYRYGTEPPGEALGCTLMSYRNDKGELMITKTKRRTHELVVASSGAGKTHGCILNEALNMDGKTSYIFTDPKGEVTERTYAYAVQKYGKENVIIANYMQPEYSNVKFNPLAKLARRWVDAENLPTDAARNSERNNIVTEVSKLTEAMFTIKATRDPTWEETARNFIFAIIMGLIEDTTISHAEEIRTDRVRTTPDQVNFATVSQIFYSFSWGGRSSLEEHGFFSSRSHDSIAYQNSRSIIDNASNTRSNYMQFVENYLRPFSEPKIRKMSDENTFDIETMAVSPKVLFIIYDLSDINVREWVNSIIANSLQSLLAFSHKTARGFDVPVVFVCDEFPSLQPHSIYPTILETGRGSNLFMILSVQSLSQIKARYPDDHVSMLENCAVRVFLGTNDPDTAQTFISTMGKMNVPSATAFLHGSYSSELAYVVTTDELMHRMRFGESYICIDREMPIHGNYTLYFETPEYTSFGITPNSSHRPLSAQKHIPQYSPKWIKNGGDDDDDDDLFKKSTSFSASRKKRERSGYKPDKKDEKPSEETDTQSAPDLPWLEQLRKHTRSDSDIIDASKPLVSDTDDTEVKPQDQDDPSEPKSEAKHDLKIDLLSDISIRDFSGGTPLNATSGVNLEELDGGVWTIPYINWQHYYITIVAGSKNSCSWNEFLSLECLEFIKIIASEKAAYTLSRALELVSGISYKSLIGYHTLHHMCGKICRLLEVLDEETYVDIHKHFCPDIADDE